MKSSSSKEQIIVLQLNYREAQLLMGLVQNPISDEESTAVENLRADLWNALSKEGVLVAQ